MSCALHCSEINSHINAFWPENFCTSRLRKWQTVVGVEYDCFKIQIIFEFHL